jgi:hypothetical protein
LVEIHLGVKLIPTPKFFPADYVSENEKIYVEARCRSCPKDRFTEFVISASKWIELLRLTFDELHPAVYLAVAWTDCVGILRVEFGSAKLVPFKRDKSIGARREDVMVAIPTKAFQKIGGAIALGRSANWI